MLNKDLFKKTMIELLSIHGIEIDRIPVDMPRLWYESVKELKDEDFLVAAERVKFSYKLSLFYILIILPGYDKEKDRSVKEYARRKYGKQVSISSTTEVYY